MYGCFFSLPQVRHLSLGAACLAQGIRISTTRLELSQVMRMMRKGNKREDVIIEMFHLKFRHSARYLRKRLGGFFFLETARIDVCYNSARMRWSWDWLILSTANWCIFKSQRIDKNQMKFVMIVDRLSTKSDVIKLYWGSDDHDQRYNHWEWMYTQ